MYKVLLVDDEKIILDGIMRTVDWARAGTVLAGTARNGIEAYEHIRRDPPDIVISDIKMPGMDGLQLIAKTAESFPAVKFILLSGYGEFEYASAAMSYGVKHFLLKPSNEDIIGKALAELVAECEQSARKDQFVNQLKYGMEKVLPHVKEQFLKEFVTNKTYGEKDWDYYRHLFGLHHLDEKKIRLILFQLEGRFEFEHLFAVKNIAEDILVAPLLSSTIGERILIVVEDTERQEELQERIRRIRKTFLAYYNIDLTVALSEADRFIKARQLYRQTLEFLHYRFYLGEGSLITMQDIVHPNGTGAADAPGDPAFDSEAETILLQMKAGRWEDAQETIRELFGRLSDGRYDVTTTKTYVIQLFVAMIRLCAGTEANEYLNRMISLLEMNTMVSVQEFFMKAAREISEKQYQRNKKRYSAIVAKMIEIIHERMGDHNLTLQAVAEQMLYMNPDYLGKLFKKETGEKFSIYLMKARIEKAKAMMSGGDNVKIFEVAEQLGYGDSPQYFSQVFKKFVGCTPSEYLRIESR
jgi:two-component system response regulator YesN